MILCPTILGALPTYCGSSSALLMIYDPNSKQNGMDRKGAKMLHELATLTYGKVQYLNTKEGIL